MGSEARQQAYPRGTTQESNNFAYTVKKYRLSPPCDGRLNEGGTQKWGIQPSILKVKRFGVQLQWQGDPCGEWGDL